MSKRTMPFVLALALACGDDGGTSGPTLPSLTLFPGDAAADVSVAARVTAQIPREQAVSCRFDAAATSIQVSRGGQPVAGTLVFFVDGLRVDFTPSGMFDYATTYSVDVSLPCAQPAHASFTTRSQPAMTPDLQPGDAFRMVDLAIDEPGAIAPILRGFLDSAELVLQVLEVGPTELRMLGGEGLTVLDAADPYLRVFRPNAFLFEMLGTYKAPYFQIEGMLSVPVDDTSDITLERFEISGRLVGDRPLIEIGESSIRASSPCDQVCAVQDSDIQLVCGNRQTICDAAGDMNVVGTYSGTPNELRAYQMITLSPADGATGVLTSASVEIDLSHAVAPSAGAVYVELRAPGGTPIAGSTLIDPSGLSATFTPAAPLAPNTTYTLLAIAHAAIESTFTTGDL